MKRLIIASCLVLLAAPLLLAEEPESRTITSPDEARGCLLRAYHLQYGAEPDLSQAIALMRKVTEYDPSFEAHFRDEGSLHLFAMARLGWAYWDAKDYGNALETFGLADSLFRQKHPDEPSTDLTSAIMECRRLVADPRLQSTRHVSVQTSDQGKVLMHEAYYMLKRDDEMNRAKAIDILKRVAAFDAGLDAQFPEERVRLNVTAGLGWEYRRSESHGLAAQAFTVSSVLHMKKHPEMLPPDIIGVAEQCHAKASASREMNWPPIVVSADGPSLPDGGAMDGGLLTAPAGEIGRLLKLDVRKDNARGSVALSTRGASGKSLVLLPGVRNASANGKALGLPVAPKRQGDDLVIPVRAVAEYFGAQVKWDPVARIAWLQ